MHQTSSADEIIVIDNNCIDRTVKIALLYPGVRVVKETQQGMIPARNRGFEEAQHEIMARIDSDTIVMPNWIETLRRTFENYEVDAVTGPCFFYDVPKKYRKHAQKIHALTYFGGTKVFFGYETLFGSNMAITKQIWGRIKNAICDDEQKVHEDQDLAIHIHDAGGKIRFEHELLGSISSRRFRTDPANLMKYLAKWPGTKMRHRGLRIFSKPQNL